METFSELLAFFAGNSPVPGEFPAQRPVTRNFNIFFDLRPNKRLSNNREAGDLRRLPIRYNVIVMSLSNLAHNFLLHAVHDMFNNVHIQNQQNLHIYISMQVFYTF